MKESAQLEYNCFKIENIKFLVSPCLKYALYNINLFHAFKDWKKSKYSDIKKLKKYPKKLMKMMQRKNWIEFLEY